MGKGLGIAVLIIAAIAIIIPLYGIYLGLITAILGIVVAVLKEKAFAIAIGALNIMDAVFLTPSLKLAHAGAQLAGQNSDARRHSIYFLDLGWKRGCVDCGGPGGWPTQRRGAVLSCEGVKAQRVMTCHRALGKRTGVLSD